MFSFICDYQHRWIIQSPLYMLPCWTPSYTAALVVPPWMRGSFNRFLTIFSPRVIIRRNIRHLQAYRRHPHHPLQPHFPALFGAMAAARGASTLSRTQILRAALPLQRRRRQRWLPRRRNLRQVRDLKRRCRRRQRRLLLVVLLLGFTGGGVAGERR